MGVAKHFAACVNLPPPPKLLILDETLKVTSFWHSVCEIHCIIHNIMCVLSAKLIYLQRSVS